VIGERAEREHGHSVPKRVGPRALRRASALLFTARRSWQRNGGGVADTNRERGREAGRQKGEPACPCPPTPPGSVWSRGNAASLGGAAVGRSAEGATAACPCGIACGKRGTVWDSAVGIFSLGEAVSRSSCRSGHSTLRGPFRPQTYSRDRPH
jgi:hypothetical protein